MNQKKSDSNSTNGTEEVPYCVEGDGVTNTSWIICGKTEPPVNVPEAKVFDPADIDSRLFDVYVAPSKWQDPSKVNLTWRTESVDAKSLSMQIVFLNYDYISIDGLDELVVKLRTNDAFLSQKDSK